MSLPRDLTDFTGFWQLHREIDFADRDQQASFQGAARLTPQGTGLIYEESGDLTLGTGRPLYAERRYLWEPAAGGIAMSFADGRPFHTFPLAPASEASHDCPPDLYRVSYAFHDWPVWTATWRVTGPRKDYTMLSLYTRPA